jgi:hypothetical protein
MIDDKVLIVLKDSTKPTMDNLADGYTLISLLSKIISTNTTFLFF